MTGRPGTVTELLDLLRPDQALCAFNSENFDTLKPALEAAAELNVPVVVAFTLPAARYWGFGLTSEIVGSLARHYGTRYALHLDHCEFPEALQEAVDAGFSSANYLNEGEIAPAAYLPNAQRLRTAVGERASLEFVLGVLGHIDDAPGGHVDGNARQPPSIEEVREFAVASGADIIGFECGSLHGMRDRAQDLDLPLISGVRAATGLPIVLHGSSGVRGTAVQAGIDAGIRKINVETALRTVFMDTVRTTTAGGSDGARKPRYLTQATDTALRALYTDILTSYTLRKG